MFALGCASSAGEPAGGTGGVPSSTNSGGAASGGPSSAGESGSSNGESGGAVAAGAGGATAAAGNGPGGRSNGGSGGAASGGAAGGSSVTGGSGGAGGCVKDLACKLAAPPTSGDLYQDCVDRINQFLTQCACLPPLTRRTDGEACADQMAEYDASANSAHAGAIAKICQPGGAQNECPGYSSNSQVIGLCMQQMWDEGPPPTSSCTDACYEEHGHFINMTDPTVTKVACGFYTTSSGKVWAVQNFTR